MVVDDALDPSVASRQDYQIIFSGIGDDILHFIFFVLEPSPISGTPRQILHKQIRSHQLSRKVTSYNLRPCLLNQQHPDLIPYRLTEQRLLGCRTAWEVIIHNDVIGPPVCVEAKYVEPDGEVVVLEDVDYFFGVAGVLGYGCQAVADSQLALFYVVRVDAVEELEIAVEELGGPQPY